MDNISQTGCRGEHKHRNVFSHMIMSHVFMILPCIYWVFYNFASSNAEQILDKWMSIIMTSSILLSIIYHYYYERVLCNVECSWSIFAVLFLNVYMFMKNVDIYTIASGVIILFALQKYLDFCQSGDNDFYEINHPRCHYIGGLYVMFCVYNLQRVSITE